MHSIGKVVRLAVIAGIASLVACSGGGGSGSAPVPQLELLAGNMGGPGNADGIGAAASFLAPAATAVDTAGNVYVADQGNHVIRRIAPDGSVTTLAGRPGVVGAADGTGEAARFSQPGALAVDPVGNLYVADTGNSTVRRITRDGVVTTVAGAAGVHVVVDGPATAARFQNLGGIALDAVGIAYVTDGSTVRRIAPDGSVTTLAGTPLTCGAADGTGASAGFCSPTGIAVDGAGNLYVADSYNQTIRKVAPAGLVTTLAGAPGVSGSADGVGAAARFFNPEGVAIDGAGNLYVADVANQTIRRIGPDGQVTTFAGTAGSWGYEDAVGAAARFNLPRGVAVDGAGNLYVADTSNNVIRKVALDGRVTTPAGAVPAMGSVDGSGPAARFYYPGSGTVDGAGNLYVVDDGSIRKITPAGQVSTLAGMAGTSGAADGVGAAARFNRPAALAADAAGNVYVADRDNRVIRRIDPAGQVTTLAGTAGIAGSADGVGPAARFHGPAGVAVDGAGNLYVSDDGYQAGMGHSCTIRKITAAGVVSTLAGMPGTSGSADGVGPVARFNFPAGLAVDGAGHLYVADAGNHTLRRITPAGTVSTVAGLADASGFSDGAGAGARFNLPAALAIDSRGDVYVADFSNQSIRKVTPAGVVTTLAGTPGRIGFGPGNLPGVLRRPSGVAVSGRTLYITDAHGVARVTNLP